MIDGDRVGLYNRKSNGFLTDEQESELKEKKAKKKELELQLKRKIDNQKRAQKSRDSKKIKLAKLCETNPEIKNLLKIREIRGKPRLEIEQPLLLKAIIDIAVHGSHRRTKNVRQISTGVSKLWTT